MAHGRSRAAGGAPRARGAALVTLNRPGPDVFRAQLELVHGYADLRADRAAEILAQMTPQGAFWASVAGLQASRHKWTLELLDAALRLAGFAEQRFKHALACRRPHEYSPQIQPMIAVPGHSTLPSGHSTEAHTIAYLLWRLRRGGNKRVLADQLLRQAARIAVNRTVAGLHFPVDSAAGQVLGLTLGKYFTGRCGATASVETIDVRRCALPGQPGLQFPGSARARRARRPPAPARIRYVKRTGSLAVPRSPLLAWLWERARREW